MMDFPILLLTLFSLVWSTTMLGTIFHELGHAIAAILVTKEKVTIYIGSYGDSSKSVKLNIGLLEVWSKHNPFLWRQGICVPSAKNISVNRQIIYTIAGPILSLLYLSVVFYFTLELSFQVSAKFTFLAFLVVSIFYQLKNLLPRETPVPLYSGGFTYNDGYLLRRLFHYKRFQKEFETGLNLHILQKYEETIRHFESVLKSGVKEPSIYKVLINSYIQIDNYQRAKECVDDFNTLDKMDSDDYGNAALIYSHLNLYEESLKFYNQSLHLNPKNIYTLANMGYTMTLLERYSEAIDLFDTAIEIDNEFAYAFSNRGLSKIRLGHSDDGLQDINHSFQLEADNPYGHRDLGVYHLDRNESEEALRHFKKAKELNNKTHQIEDLISSAERRLKK